MKEKLILTAVPMLMLGAAANAQMVQKPFSAAVGINYPVDKDVRDGTQDIGWRVDLGYRFMLNGANYLNNADTSIEVSWNRNESGGSRVENLGAYVVGRWYFQQGMAGGSRPYGGLGIGAVRSEVKGDAPVPVGGSSAALTVPGGSESKWNFGARAILGMTFGGGAFVEAAYNWNGKVSGVRTDSLSLSVGLRF